MANSIRVVIAAGPSRFSDRLRRKLANHSDISLDGEARTGDEIARLVRELQPDVVLVDHDLAGASRAGILASIRASCPQARTILLTSSLDPRDTIKALQLGVRGIVMKVAAPEIVLSSIRAVMEGLYWLEDRGVTELGDTFNTLVPRNVPPPGVFGLTERDREIVAMVVAGLTNRKIALNLSTSEDAVKHHLTRIYQTLNVSSRLELAVFAAHHGLLGRSSRD